MKKIAALFLLTLASATVFAAADVSSAASVGTVYASDQDNRRRRGRGNDDSNSNNNSNSNSNSNRSGSTPSAENARRAALEAVPGEIVKEEFEREHGRSIWEFYIRKSDGSTFEVYVDADTGKVVKIERN